MIAVVQHGCPIENTLALHLLPIFSHAPRNRPDSNFFYLTGCSEPGFAAMIGKGEGGE